jgi:hypothetical protein
MSFIRRNKTCNTLLVSNAIEKMMQARPVAKARQQGEPFFIQV